MLTNIASLFDVVILRARVIPPTRPAHDGGVFSCAARFAEISCYN
jgi:hypothetical protein